MLAFQSAIGFNVLYYANAGFSTAPAVATANILASIVGGVLKLPIAKLLNIWGRAEGFLVFIVVYVVGLIILATCNGPNGYAAGYVLFYVGYSALYLILDVFIADTSGLRNRAFTFAFASTPFICTAFTGPLAAQAFISISPTSGWRWAYGAFAIIMPVVFAPLIFVFKFYQNKAEKMGLFKREDRGRTTIQSIIHYFHEFDGKSISLHSFQSLICISRWCNTSHGRIYPLALALQSGDIRQSTLWKCYLHRHGRCRVLPLLRLRCLGEMVRYLPLCPLGTLQATHRPWSLLSCRHPLLQLLLVGAQLLQLCSSRLRSQYC